MKRTLSWLLVFLAMPFIAFADDELLERWLARATFRPKDLP